MVDGRQAPLAAPILVLSAKRCFPGKVPEKQPFTLPNYSGSSAASLKAGATTVAAILPDLALDSKTVADYSLKLGAVQTVAFAKLDLSRKLSGPCAHDLQNALADGDRLGWFKVINEAVIADALSFEIHWQSGTSVEARKSIKQRVFREITRMTQSSRKPGPAAKLSSGVRVDTDKKMVMETKGSVILAYKIRSLGKSGTGARNDFSASTETIQHESPANISTEKTDTKAVNVGRTKIAVRLIQKNTSRRVRFDYPFVKGDKFRFELTPNRDGRLYIFHQKPDKNIEMLWPRPEQILAGQQGHAVQKGRAVEIPPSPANFYFDEELTEERFYVAIAAGKHQTLVQKEIENFAVRDGNEKRRVGYAHGQNSHDPYLYFSELLNDSQGQAIEFRLGR